VGGALAHVKIWGQQHPLGAKHKPASKAIASGQTNFTERKLKQLTECSTIFKEISLPDLLPSF